MIWQMITLQSGFELTTQPYKDIFNYQFLIKRIENKAALFCGNIWETKDFLMSIWISLSRKKQQA
jgi:hypothetical protein